MSIKLLRTALVALEVLVAISALGGGIGLLTGGIQFPSDWVQAMPFDSQIIPGLILAIVVGGSALAAAWLVIINHSQHWLVSMAAGFFLVCFEMVEVAVEPQIVWLQPLFFGVGIAIMALAALLQHAEVSRSAQITSIPEDERQPIGSGTK